ncbi:MAG: hypothetical protein RSC91_12935, partial [Clostridia bacterium]
MKHLSARFKSKYLFQLISTCVLFFLVPCILGLGIFMTRTYQHFVQTNRSYYEETTLAFGRHFDSMLSTMKKQASRLELESRLQSSELSLLGTLAAQTNNYYVRKALDHLTKYNSLNSYDLGLYYFDSQTALYKSAKFTLARLSRALGVREENAAAFEAFFAPTGELGMRRFVQGDKLLIGFPARLGKGRREVLALYELSSASLDSRQFASATTFDSTFCVYDGSALLLANRQEGLSTFDPSLSQASGSAEFREEGIRYLAFSKPSPTTAFTYACVLPFDHMTANTYHLFATQQLTLILEVVLFVVLLVLFVHINYR